MRYDPWGYVLLVVTGLVGTANSMYFVRTSKKVIQYLQVGDMEGLKYVGIAGMFFVCSIFLYRFFVRATHPITYQRTYASLKAKYLERYVRLDNNSVERLGTGKLVGIITSGINSRVHILGTI